MFIKLNKAHMCRIPKAGQQSLCGTYTVRLLQIVLEHNPKICIQFKAKIDVFRMHIYFAILTFSKVYYSIFYFVCELTRTFNSFTPCKWIRQINNKKMQTTTKKPKLITPNRLPKNPLFFIYLFAFKCINSCFKTQSILQWYIIQLSLM